MSRRPPQVLRLVDDQQIDARASTACVGELRPLDQRLERDRPRGGAASNGLKPSPKSRSHVGEARVVEQREHLVILAPQLAEPLHGERFRRDDEAALDVPRVHQVVEDEARLDRLAEADFVGQQPAHRRAAGGALRDVELVREQADASAEKRAEPLAPRGWRAGGADRAG